MADDENKPGEPAASEPSGEGADEGERAEKKGAAKAAPVKKAAAKKAAAADTGEGPRVEVSISAPAAPGRRAAAPRAFWWRALLMVAVVVILFSIIRDMAKGPQGDGTTEVAETGAPSTTLTGEIGKLVGEGEVSVEEAPTDEPVTDNGEPAAPCYYGYPYPPQPYYYPPSAGTGPGQPAYPMAPPGGYASPWTAPYGYWIPSPYPGYAPVPEESAPEAPSEAQ